MAPPGIGFYVIGVAIVAALYYVFSGSQEHLHSNNNNNSSRRNRRSNDRYDPRNTWNSNTNNNYHNRRRSSNKLWKSDECSICQDTWPSNKLRTLPCAHIFHEECISQWEKRERSCPNCRCMYT